MKHKKIIWIAFALLVLLQLWVPASVIFSKEDTLSTGVAYKFKTAPVDPNDYLRGKYVSLQFDQDRFTVNDNMLWRNGEVVYVNLGIDSAGFAKIMSISKDKINDQINYIKTTIDYIISNQPLELSIKWPFDRLYMEESKAPLAEEAYNKLRTDSNMISYALVKVKNGDAVLENVFINDQPIGIFIKK